MWIYDDVIRSNSLGFFKVEKSYLLCQTNIPEIKGTTIYILLCTYILLLQLLREFSSICCRDFPGKTGLIPPTEHIFAWY